MNIKVKFPLWPCDSEEEKKHKPTKETFFIFSFLIKMIKIKLFNTLCRFFFFSLLFFFGFDEFDFACFGQFYSFDLDKCLM